MTELRSRTKERLFQALCMSAALIPLAVLGVLLLDVVIDASARLDWNFLTGFPSRHPESAGVYPAIMGSAALVLLVVVLALPVGVGAAIYLEEYEPKGRIADLIEVNIANLAGVPSVIYGLLGLELFARVLGLGRSILAGSLTMALLVLPIVIMASREALRTVPDSLREAGLALGATRWQVVRRVVLPAAAPGIVTGTILAVARAIGEAAPLVVLGALTYITFAPRFVTDPFTVLPIQIFSWVSRPQKGFVVDAAAAIVVLMVIMLTLSAVASWIRDRQRQRMSR